MLRAGVRVPSPAPNRGVAKRLRPRPLTPAFVSSNLTAPTIHNKQEKSMQHKITQQEIALIEKAINSGARAEVCVERGELIVVEIKRKLLSVQKRPKTT